MLEQLRVPIVQAPMAGGPSTPALAAAVCEAGGLGFLAGGFRATDGVAEDLCALRGLTECPFGVNLMCPGSGPADEATIAEYARRIGADPAPARFDDDDYGAKLELVERERPAVVSFTFGCPDRPLVRRLQQGGSRVWVTVTTPEEAETAERAGADAVIAQGVEAGGHRGGFGEAPGDYGLLALLQLVRARTALPMIAAGGIATPGAVAAVLAAGASAAQVGTAFMRCPEAGTFPPHREALASDRRTALTRAFTGRLARGIENSFMREHSEHAPEAYPEIAYLTAPLRAAGDPQRAPMWAGQAHALAPELPAAEVVALLGAGVRR